MTKKKNDKENDKASLDAQARLAEILSDSPHLVSLNGTEWEVKALRMGTQWMIAQKCCEIEKADSKTFGDIIKQFSTNIPAVLEVLTLVLLNDKNKIFKDGIESNGYSDLYKSTYNTLKWECNVSEFAEMLLESLQLLDTNFFMETLDMLQIFRVSVTEKKRMMKANQK